MDAALEISNGREMPHYCKVKSDSATLKFFWKAAEVCKEKSLMI